MKISVQVIVHPDDDAEASPVDAVGQIAAAISAARRSCI